MSWRNPVLVMPGFLKWFSTRRGTKSGHTAPVEIRMSESIAIPELMAVISRMTGASPFFAQSGVHPNWPRPIRARAIAYRAFMPCLRALRSSDTSIFASEFIPLPLDDPRGDEEQELVVRV